MEASSHRTRTNEQNAGAEGAMHTSTNTEDSSDHFHRTIEAPSSVGINAAPISFAPTFPIRAPPVLTSAVGELHIHILSSFLPL